MPAKEIIVSIELLIWFVFHKNKCTNDLSLEIAAQLINTFFVTGNYDLTFLLRLRQSQLEKQYCSHSQNKKEQCLDIKAAEEDYQSRNGGDQAQCEP